MYPDYEDKYVLDLYAGTGSLGLEALSRGARWVDFVEFSSTAIAILIQNIHKLNCHDTCHVWRKRCDAYLKAPPRGYDVIFLDPPYAKGLVNPTLEAIFQNGVLNPGGTVIAEHSPKEPIGVAFKAMLISMKASRENSFSLLRADGAQDISDICAESKEFD